MGRRKRGAKADCRGGGFDLLPRCLTSSEAWRTASPRTTKAIVAILRRHNGFNNGKIAMSLSDLAYELDSQNHHANSRALAEAHARGICLLARSYPKGSRLAREYQLTFIESADGPPTHEYLKWVPGDLGSRRKPTAPTPRSKTRTAEIAADRARSVKDFATERKVSAADTAMENLETDGQLPMFPELRPAVSAGHIISHSGQSKKKESSDGKIGSFWSSPFQNASSAPSTDALRARAGDLIGALGRGTQSRLATLAKIPIGTLSKFLKRDGPLSPKSRVLLSCALGRLEAEWNLTGHTRLGRAGLGSEQNLSSEHSQASTDLEGLHRRMW